MPVFSARAAEKERTEGAEQRNAGGKQHRRGQRMSGVCNEARSAGTRSLSDAEEKSDKTESGGRKPRTEKIPARGGHNRRDAPGGYTE